MVKKMNNCCDIVITGKEVKHKLCETEEMVVALFNMILTGKRNKRFRVEKVKTKDGWTLGVCSYKRKKKWKTR
jgi:hypothetical protein